jgi:hypothetical protein
VIYIDAITVALVCRRCGERLTLEGPQVQVEDIAVAEQEHTYQHDLKEIA